MQQTEQHQNEQHQTPATINVFNPQDGSLVGDVPNMNEADVRRIIDTACHAFERNRHLPVHTRIQVLSQVADAVHQQREDFARLLAQEGIKTLREARKEVLRCINTLRLSAEEARRLHGETINFDQVPGSENRFGYYRRLPLGVVLAITPFNDPLNLVAHKIGPAIASGNALILKPHSETPLVAQKLVKLFEVTALPKGLLQLVTGRGADIGDRLVSDPRIRMLSFTGGREIGERIQPRTGLKKLAMELGSNCPVIVMGDADLATAVDACLSGAFWAAGQNCLHVQRIFIHESLYCAFSAAFCAGAKAVKMGDKLDEETDMGPLINERAAARVEKQVKEALAMGASLLCGGERQGNFYAPTVLENVPHQSPLAQEEIFGPVTLLYTFSNPQDAITQANHVEYGLQAGIFTRDLNTAFQMADALDCGGVMINDSSDYRIDAMPFGGVKGSGLGREGVAHALQEMTELKTYCFNLSPKNSEACVL